MSFGYAAKDLIATAKTLGPTFEWVSYASFVVSAASVAVASVAAIRVFWRRGGQPLPASVHEASVPMIAAPLGVAAVGTVLGLAPALVEPLVVAAARAMLPEGVSLIGVVRSDVGSVGSTLGVFAFGAVVFVGWEAIHRVLAAATWLDRYGFASWFDRLLIVVPLVARAMTTRLQHGRLPGYVAVFVLVFVVAIVATLASGDPVRLPPWSLPGPLGTIAAVLIGGAAVGACLVRDPFVMVLLTGLTGGGTALLMVALGAPDVALTQFTVEVAFVVVVAAAVRRLRATALPAAGGPMRVWRMVTGLALGGAVAALLLATQAGPFDPSMGDYFGQRSLPDAHGRNVVNVIIVDFRALDTLGEIVVILLTAVVAWPLVNLVRRRVRLGDGS